MADAAMLLASRDPRTAVSLGGLPGGPTDPLRFDLERAATALSTIRSFVSRIRDDRTLDDGMWWSLEGALVDELGAAERLLAVLDDEMHANPLLPSTWPAHQVRLVAPSWEAVARLCDDLSSAGPALTDDSLVDLVASHLACAAPAAATAAGLMRIHSRLANFLETGLALWLARGQLPPQNTRPRPRKRPLLVLPRSCISSVLRTRILAIGRVARILRLPHHPAPRLATHAPAPSLPSSSLSADGAGGAEPVSSSLSSSSSAATTAVPALTLSTQEAHAMSLAADEEAVLMALGSLRSDHRRDSAASSDRPSQQASAMPLAGFFAPPNMASSSAVHAVLARIEALAQARLWRFVVDPAAGSLLKRLATLRAWCLLANGHVFRALLAVTPSDPGAAREPDDLVPLSLHAGDRTATVTDVRVSQARLGAAWEAALAAAASATHRSDDADEDDDDSAAAAAAAADDDDGVVGVGISRVGLRATSSVIAPFLLCGSLQVQVQGAIASSVSAEAASLCPVSAFGLGDGTPSTEGPTTHAASHLDASVSNNERWAAVCLLGGDAPEPMSGPVSSAGEERLRRALSHSAVQCAHATALAELPEVATRSLARQPMTPAEMDADEDDDHDDDDDYDDESRGEDGRRRLESKARRSIHSAIEACLPRLTTAFWRGEQHHDVTDTEVETEAVLGPDSAAMECGGLVAVVLTRRSTELVAVVATCAPLSRRWRVQGIAAATGASDVVGPARLSITTTLTPASVRASVSIVLGAATAAAASASSTVNIPVSLTSLRAVLSQSVDRAASLWPALPPFFPSAQLPGLPVPVVCAWGIAASSHSSRASPSADAWTPPIVGPASSCVAIGHRILTTERAEFDRGAVSPMPSAPQLPSSKSGLLEIRDSPAHFMSSSSSSTPSWVELRRVVVRGATSPPVAATDLRYSVNASLWWHSGIVHAVPWPASLVVGAAERRVYALLSMQLLRLRRARLELDEAWLAMRAAESAAAATTRRRPPPVRRREPSSPVEAAVVHARKQAVQGQARAQLRRAALVRWSLHASLSAVERLWHVDVIGASFDTLVQSVAASRDFAELVLSHRRFLATVVTHSLLSHAEAAGAVARLEAACRRLRVSTDDLRNAIIVTLAGHDSSRPEAAATTEPNEAVRQAATQLAAAADESRSAARSLALVARTAALSQAGSLGLVPHAWLQAADVLVSVAATLEDTASA